jgi:uncharacterized membrane protein
MTILLIITLIAVAQAAGITYVFSAAVMRALGRLQPRDGIAAMQAINVAVFNPWFMGAFLGPGLLCAAVAVVALIEATGARQAAICIGAGLYLVGYIGVTAGGNVPLNDALARESPGAESAHRLWVRYLRVWTRYNTLRTAAALAAAIAFAVALALPPG